MRPRCTGIESAAADRQGIAAGQGESPAARAPRQSSRSQVATVTASPSASRQASAVAKYSALASR